MPSALWGELQLTTVDGQLIMCVEWQGEDHDIHASVALSSVEISGQQPHLFLLLWVAYVGQVLGQKKTMLEFYEKLLLASLILVKQSCVD